VADSHPQVRLEAVNALRLTGPAEAARLAVYVLDQDVDQNIDFALWLTLRSLEDRWLEKVIAGEDPEALNEAEPEHVNPDDPMPAELPVEQDPDAVAPELQEAE